MGYWQGWRRSWLGVLAAWLAISAWAAEPPPLAPLPAATGKALLFFSAEPRLDAAYAAELRAAGYQVAQASFYDPIEPAFFRQFDTIVLDGLPNAAAEYDVFGHKMLIFWANLGHIWQAMEDGAGVLVYATIAGGASVGGWDREMARWNIRVRQACVVDLSLCFSEWRAYGPNWYAWTENLARHPATAGLRRVYYPAANLRWDDFYTAPPLVAGPEWTPLVRAMPGALIGTGIQSRWHFEPRPEQPPVLVAVRQAGKGRLAAVALNPIYTHRYGYTKPDKGSIGEQSVGVLDGIILKQGDGAVPSDTAGLLDQLYRWLGEGAAAAQPSGYREGTAVPLVPHQQTDEEKAFSPVLDFDHLQQPPSWRHRPTRVVVNDETYYPEFSDPLVKGELRYFKALVGARTRYSDGQGTVAEYAAAARAAGYHAIVFTETFEQLAREDYPLLQEECRLASSDDFVAVPGLDIADPYGNRFLVLNAPTYPPAGWLSADGQRLVRTQMINLCWHTHMVVIHRPSTSPLAPERAKHFQGWSTITYRDGQVVDDSFATYAWQVMSGSNPHPVAVHEVTSPAEVAAAAKLGFQQILPSDTVRNAVMYFHTGINHYFDAPARYLISEGPIVTQFVATPKDAGPVAQQRDRFRVSLAVEAEEPLAWVALMDGYEELRRWTPGAKTFSATADLPHDRQYGLYVLAQDSKGRRVLTNSLRTVVGRYHNRCGDRQNWLGHCGQIYAGLEPPKPLTIALPIQGTPEGSAIFTNVRGTTQCTALNFPLTTNDVVLTETRLDEVFTTALRQDVGADAMPAQLSKPSSVYAGRIRYYNFTAGRPGVPNLVVAELEATLKRPVRIAGQPDSWPTFAGVLLPQTASLDAAGKLTQAELPKSGVVPVPVGAMGGGMVALSPGLQVSRKGVGLALPADPSAMLPAGTRFSGRLLYFAPAIAWRGQPTAGPLANKPAETLAALGCGGTPPYRLEFTRGKLVSPRFPLECETQSHGVAGQVATPAEIGFDLALRLPGLQRYWAAGVWRPSQPIRWGGVFEDTGYLRLDVAQGGPFYAGNLLTADHPRLALQFVHWTAERVKVEVHNPTGAAITATIATPPEVTDRKALRQQVTVPPGTTVYAGE